MTGAGESPTLSFLLDCSEIDSIIFTGTEMAQASRKEVARLCSS